MRLLTTNVHLRAGQKLKFVPRGGTNPDYVGLECTLSRDYNGEDIAHIQVMSPAYKRLQHEECYVMVNGKPRLAILNSGRFGNWFKEHGL